MITIYGKENCTECDKAKLICQMRGVPFEYKQVGVDLTLEDLEKVVGTKVRAVPQIFDSGVYVGNYQALRKHFLKGAANG